MCYNAGVSFTTYVVGTIGCVLLYRKGYAAEAMLYACVIQMQLIEYMLWTNQYNAVNKIVTKLGIVINHLEPVVFWIGIKMFGLQIPKWLDMMMISYVLYSIIYTQSLWSTIDYTHVSEQSKPHLHWKWNEGRGHGLYYTYFLLVLYLLSIYGLPKTNGRNTKHGMIVLLSFATSYLIYGKKHSVGAMWCFMAAVGPWFLPIIYKY